MENLFITNIRIDKVRHLTDINIPLSENERKHLILTGKNGSGKTSVLEAIKSYITVYFEEDAPYILDFPNDIRSTQENIKKYNLHREEEKIEYLQEKLFMESLNNQYNQYYKGLRIKLSSEADLISAIQKGNCIVAYFSANRYFKAEEAKHIEKIILKDKYTIDDSPGKKLLQYLLDLKTTSALAEKSGKHDKAKEIDDWFISFENMLKEIFEDNQLKLDFDLENFKFTIVQTGREPFDFNTMASGYSAVLDIVIDIIMRMDKNSRRFYSLPGIVIIDEIETHLHIDLQKKILPFLTKTFPNLQFIVSTHSPFILNSIENAIIYDLEKHKLVEDLSAYSYEGIIEYYFNNDMYSNKIKKQFETYKRLINKDDRTEEEGQQLVDAITYLKQIPPKAAEELVFAFRQMEEQRREKAHGKN